MFRLFISLTFLIIYTLSASSEEDKLKERIRSLKKVKMIEYLELDDEKADKLIIKFNSLEGQIDNSTDELNEAIDKLEKAVDSGESASKLKDLSNEVKLKTESMYNMQKLKLEEIDKILDDEEFARYIVFEHTFREELKSKLNTARRKRNTTRAKRNKE